MNNVKEPLIKSQNTLSRHTPQGRLRTSGACQNLVKTINYSALASCVALPPASMQSWMQVFTSMTECILDLRALKFISGSLLIVSFALSGITFTQAASDDFGRLFTTPEERRKLQALRYAESEPAVIEEIEIPVVLIDEVAEEIEQPDIEGITLNGLVYRKGSKSTVWLNGTNSYEGSLASEYFRIKADDINSEKVSVTVPEVGLEFDLKVGQTYEPNDGSLLDIVEDDVPFIIK